MRPLAVRDRGLHRGGIAVVVDRGRRAVAAGSCRTATSRAVADEDRHGEDDREGDRPAQPVIGPTATVRAPGAGRRSPAGCGRHGRGARRAAPVLGRAGAEGGAGRGGARRSDVGGGVGPGGRGIGPRVISPCHAAVQRASASGHSRASGRAERAATNVRCQDFRQPAASEAIDDGLHVFGGTGRAAGRRCGRSSPARRRALRPGHGRGRARLHRRVLGPARGARAGRACSCPRPTAVSGSGSSTWSS